MEDELIKDNGEEAALEVIRRKKESDKYLRRGAACALLILLCVFGGGIGAIDLVTSMCVVLVSDILAAIFMGVSLELEPRPGELKQAMKLLTE